MAPQDFSGTGGLISGAAFCGEFGGFGVIVEVDMAVSSGLTGRRLLSCLWFWD